MSQRIFLSFFLLVLKINDVVKKYPCISDFPSNYQEYDS